MTEQSRLIVFCFLRNLPKARENETNAAISMAGYPDSVEMKMIACLGSMDDIFGELDPPRRNALMNHLPDNAQKWITTTHLDWLRETPRLGDIRRFTVGGGGCL